MTQPSHPHSDQARNSEMDKTDAYRGSGPYANQGGGKLGSGTRNSGHPANDVINPHSRLGDSDRVQPQGGEQVGDHIGEQDASMQRGDAAGKAGKAGKVGDVQGTKGSGSPTLSGAGARADDRPGRNEPKSEHASSSLNTHE